MRRGFRLVGRGVLAAVGAVVVVVGTVVSVLAYPQPFFPYHASEGRLTVYSDRPFATADGETLLREVERRITLSPLDQPDIQHAIFIANSEWRRRLVFTLDYGAGGVNYYPITRNVFIRQADIATNTVFKTNGEAVPPPRTLAYYCAHEIGHSLIGMRIGGVANWRLPVWIREGLADYIGMAGAVNIDALTADLRSGTLDTVRLGYYTRYRLLVAFFLERRGWSVDRLLASDLPEAEAERQLLAVVTPTERKTPAGEEDGGRLQR